MAHRFVCPTAGPLADLLGNSGALNLRQSSLRSTTSETKPKRRVGVPHVCRRNDARKFDATCPESRLFAHVARIPFSVSDSADIANRASPELDSSNRCAVASACALGAFLLNCARVETVLCHS